MTGYTCDYVTGANVWTPRRPRVGKYPVLALHGMGGNSRTFNNDSSRNTSRFMGRLASRGFTLYSVSLGDGFGAPSEPPDIETMRLWAATNLPWTDPAKLVLIGYSMGGTNAWSYRRDYPTRVGGILGIQTGSDLEDVRTRDPIAGSRAAVDAAWGVVYPAPLPPAGQFPNLAPTLRGIPYLGYYSSGDTAATPAKVQEWAALVQGTAAQAGASGHGDGIFADLPVADVAAFLETCGA